jgi:dihydrolipoamide dehydrogenase
MVRHCRGRFEAMVDASVTGVEKTAGGLVVRFDQAGRAGAVEADRVLAAVGRKPNTTDLGLAEAGVKVDDRGFVAVDDQGRTAVPSIWAVGDVVAGPALAHKASREAKVAAEAIAGQPSAFDNRAIPAVVFTDPEIAWAGLTEEAARTRGTPVTVGRFPLQALGRARTLGRTEGLVKVIADPDSRLVLGVGMVGPHVSELIAEGTLALEMGATLEDLMVTIHPHPTLSEAILEAAESAAGAAVHTLPPRRSTG